MVSFHACSPTADLSGSLSGSVKIVPSLKSDPDVSVFVRLRFIIASEKVVCAFQTAIASYIFLCYA